LFVVQKLYLIICLKRPNRQSPVYINRTCIKETALSMASFHYLTKSRYMQGLQCPKYLWLSINEPELGAEIDEATQHLFTVGKRVGPA
jgi:hypothetical protein